MHAKRSVDICDFILLLQVMHADGNYHPLLFHCEYLNIDYNKFKRTCDTSSKRWIEPNR